MGHQIEDLIRDKLILNLSVIEDGLVLLEKEKYLRHSMGTRGFIDILARDDQNNFVIIELKRSNAACREAIHEVLKYIEGVKDVLRVNEDEIRVFVVSTEWDELLVPFSSFVQRVSCNVHGLLLNVDANLEPISATPISPLILKNERFISTRHAVSLYETEENLQKGFTSYVNSMRFKGIEDYVLVQLQAPPGFHEQNVQATYQMGVQIGEYIGSDRPLFSVEQLGQKMRETPHMLYFAAQLLDKERYRRILSVDKERLQITDEFLEDAGDEEALAEYESAALYDLKPKSYEDHWEMGYQGKFMTIIQQEGWEIASISRQGAFQKNKLLSDEAILDELIGAHGATRQRYRKSFDSRNKSRFDRILSDLSNCLRDNPTWRSHITQIITRLKSIAGDIEFSGKIYVYNPNNMLHSLYMADQREDGMLFIPMYHIQVDFPEKGLSLHHYGEVAPNGRTPDFQNILDTHYNGKISKMAQPLIWAVMRRVTAAL